MACSEAAADLSEFYSFQTLGQKLKLSVRPPEWITVKSMLGNEEIDSNEVCFGLDWIGIVIDNDVFQVLVDCFVS